MFIGGTILLVIIFAALLAPFLTPYSPLTMVDDIVEPPSLAHPLGTDTLGRDVLSRVLFGTRISLLVGFIAVLVSLSVGVSLGCISGFIRGNVERVLVLFMDCAWSFPIFVLALLIAIVLSPDPPSIAIAVGLGYTPQFFRVIHGIVVSIRERTFIEADKSLGAGSLYIIYHDILPYIISSILVLATMGMAQSILVVSGLGFVGVGIQPPTPELGTDLGWGKSVLLDGKWWPCFFPSLMIFFILIGFNLFGDGLNALLLRRGHGRF